MKKFLVVFSLLGLIVAGLAGCKEASDLQNEPAKTYNEAAAQVDSATYTAIQAKESAERKMQEIQDAAAEVSEATEAVSKIVQ